MKISWGVLGSTGIARRRTIPEGIVEASNARLVSVYAPTSERNKEVAEEFSAEACSSVEELLSTDCRIVYVASPNDTHCDLVVQAANAGKHVFCEKPLGVSVEEAERMVSVCADAGVKFGVGFMMRFHSYHQEAKRLLEEGRIGRPVYGRAQLSCWYPPIEGAWRQFLSRGGGGTLPDLASHCIDLLEMFLGRTRKVSCLKGSLVQDYESEDTAVVMLEFESGAMGTVDTLFNVPDVSSKNRLELYGSKGSIRAEETIGQGDGGRMVAYFEESDSRYEALQERDKVGDILISPPKVNTYRAEIEAFSDAILNDATPPVDGSAGLWSQRIVAACYESAHSGHAVSL